MTTDSSSSWDPRRWRDSQRYEYFSHLPTPMPVNQRRRSIDRATRESSHDRNSGKETSNAGDVTQDHSSPYAAEPFSEASTFQSETRRRHSLHPGGKYGPQPLPSYLGDVSSWRSLQCDDVAPGSGSRISNAPLTLHIPRPQDLPRISPPYGIFASESQSQIPGRADSGHTTSLPSFASFEERSSRRDNLDPVDNAPLDASTTCYLCTKLKPMVEDVAVAVGELHESAQSMYNLSACSVLAYPTDSPVRCIEWILDRLEVAKASMRAVANKQDTSYRQASPPFSLKRPPERWLSDEFSSNKRARSGASPEAANPLISATFNETRRGSVDTTAFDHSRPGFSPAPTESIPGSAYPRTGSPVLSTRPFRALPSPSSLAYPPSAAPSVAPGTAQSIGSPVTSYQPTVSIHTASTNSVTSAHIADLQHQVTLKSLALQTLQSEYASLLQKLQRERVKSQTISKKTDVADQEVNELTTRNEDLSEQLRSLETQLEDTARRRENERGQYVQEKEQWARMLSQGSQLHTKSAADLQIVKHEKAQLARRVAEAESGRLPSNYESIVDETAQTYDGGTAVVTDKSQSEQGITHENETVVAGLSSSASPSDLFSLQREVQQLRTRNDALRRTLDEIEWHNTDIDEQARNIISRQNGIVRAIGSARNDVPCVRQKQRSKRKRDRSVEKTHSDYALARQVEIPSTSSSTMAPLASAAPPGPADLGSTLLASLRSPEDVIRALGPVPPPPSSLQHSSISSAAIPTTDRLSKNRDRSWPPQATTELDLQRRVPSLRQSKADVHGHEGSYSPHEDDSDSPPPTSASTSSNLPEQDGATDAIEEASLDQVVVEREEQNVQGFVQVASEHRHKPAPASSMPPPPRPAAYIPI